MRLILFVILLALLLRGYEWVAHDYRMPWTPLSLAAPIGPFTTRKIDALADDTPRCHRLLEEAAIGYSPLPPVDAGPQCGYDNGVTLSQDQPQSIAFSPAAKTSCPMAVSLVLWERQVVNAAAARHLGTTVETITTYGSYSCRRIGGGQTKCATAAAKFLRRPCRRIITRRIATICILTRRGGAGRIIAGSFRSSRRLPPVLSQW